MGISFYILAIIFIATVLLMSVSLAVMLYVRNMKQAMEMLSSAMQASGRGVVFFNKRGRLKKFNGRAVAFFPCLLRSNGAAKTYDSFLGTVYERAVPLDSALQRFLEKTNAEELRDGFREIVRWENEHWQSKQYCLVEVRRAKNNCAVIILSDISDALQDDESFERLNEANMRLADAIQETDSGIMLSDPRYPNNPITFVNHAFCGLTQTTENHLVSGGWGILNDVFEDADELDELHRAICLAKPINVELKAAREDGYAWFNLKLNVLKHDDGEPRMMVAVLNDMTALKKREQQFFNVQKLESLGQLSAGVAHDFNNILSIICGYAQFANKPDIGCDKSRDYFERIAAAAKRGSALTKKLMMFTRHKSDVYEPYDLVALIKEHGALLAPLLDSKTALIYDLQSTPVHTLMTTDALSQILMNTVLNARDAMGDNGGSITVSLAEVDDRTSIADLPARLNDEALICLSVADMFHRCGSMVIRRWLWMMKSIF